MKRGSQRRACESGRGRAKVLGPGVIDGRMDFDPEALRARYREEREKRLRPDGIDQYVEVRGSFSHFADDPYSEPAIAPSRRAYWTRVPG